MFASINEKCSWELWGVIRVKRWTSLFRCNSWTSRCNHERRIGCEVCVGCPGCYRVGQLYWMIETIMGDCACQWSAYAGPYNVSTSNEGILNGMLCGIAARNAHTKGSFYKWLEMEPGCADKALGASKRA